MKLSLQDRVDFGTVQGHGARAGVKQEGEAEVRLCEGPHACLRWESPHHSLTVVSGFC